MLVFTANASSMAQGYPSKAISLVVPLAAGGTADLMARLFADKVGADLGQQVIVDPRPGASGQIGVSAVVRATADGHTIMLASTGPIAINPGLFGSKLPFDTLRDLIAVTQIANATAALLVHPSLPVRNIKDLIALSKRKPGDLLYASAGSGSITNLHVALFKRMAGIDLIHVPYRGAPQAVTALLSGETQLMIKGLAPSLPLAKAGKVRLLGVTSAQRNSVVPNIPTIAEAGVPGYEADQWFGIFTPAGVRSDVVARLHGAFVKALKTPDISSWLTNQGAVPIGNTPDEFAAHIKNDTAKWARVIRESGATPE